MKRIVSTIFITSALVFGCSSPNNNTDAGTDSGSAVNGCTTFTDFTATGGTISFPTAVTPGQYSPNCVKVKAHQSVTWSGAFTNHPLVPMGGDTPTPIVATATGTTVAFTFDNPGTFGFQCNFHPGTMFGAVQVTP